MKVKYHFNGRFMKNTYSGGECVEMDNPIDVDRFGFPDVTEPIKDKLKFAEIGGIYVKEQKGDWQLVSDDKDVLAYVSRCKGEQWLHFYVDTVVDPSRPSTPSLQPHVVIRPRENIIASKKLAPKNKPVKLINFVTLKILEEEKKQKTKEHRESAKRQLAMGGDEEHVEINKYEELR